MMTTISRLTSGHVHLVLDSDGDGFGDQTMPKKPVINQAEWFHNEIVMTQIGLCIRMPANCADTIDNNCDGNINEASTAIDAFAGYLDDDGDGFAGGTLEYSCTDIYYLSKKVPI